MTQNQVKSSQGFLTWLDLKIEEEGKDLILTWNWFWLDLEYFWDGKTWLDLKFNSPTWWPLTIGINGRLPRPASVFIYWPHDKKCLIQWKVDLSSQQDLRNDPLIASFAQQTVRPHRPIYQPDISLVATNYCCCIGPGISQALGEMLNVSITQVRPINK